MRAWVPRAIAVLLLAWCLATAASALTKAIERPREGRSILEAEVSALARDLPPRGVIGYIGPSGAGEPPDASALQVAQFALAPRLVQSEAWTDVVIVRRAAGSAGVDPYLAAYEPVGPGAGAHRVYRRVR